MTKNGQKYSKKKLFLMKNCNLRIPRTSTLQENPSALKREYVALQKMKFNKFFSFLWVIFALLDPGLQQCLKAWRHCTSCPNSGLH